MADLYPDGPPGTLSRVLTTVLIASAMVGTAVWWVWRTKGWRGGRRFRTLAALSAWGAVYAGVMWWYSLAAWCFEDPCALGTSSWPHMHAWERRGKWALISLAVSLACLAIAGLDRRQSERS